MNPDNAPYAFPRMPASHSRPGERWLLRIPIFVAVAFGLTFMMDRFVVVLSEDLKDPPDSWGAVLLLAIMIGTVGLVVLVACAAAGAAIGLLLRVAVRTGSRRH